MVTPMLLVVLSLLRVPRVLLAAAVAAAPGAIAVLSGVGSEMALLRGTGSAPKPEAAAAGSASFSCTSDS